MSVGTGVARPDWERRLGGLITQSDTVVFVVSLEAVKSERCTWEVDRTIELSKRLLPIIFKPVPEHDIPEKLRRLQFVRFDGGAGFARPLSQLGTVSTCLILRCRSSNESGCFLNRRSEVRVLSGPP
jgi:TIR domain